MPYNDAQKQKEAQKAWYLKNQEELRKKYKAYKKTKAGKEANDRYQKSEKGRLARSKSKYKARWGINWELFKVYNDFKKELYLLPETKTLPELKERFRQIEKYKRYKNKRKEKT